MVTSGEANDSPYLREMIGMMPPGSGDVLATRHTGASKTAMPYATADAGP